MFDRSGKTTFLRAFNKATEYRHTVIDRAFISTIMYSLKFHRDYSPTDYFEQLKLISGTMKVLIVYCTCSTQTIHKRVKATKEKDYIAKDKDSLLLEIDRDKSRFNTIIDLLPEGINVITIDTDKSVELCIDDVLQYINKYEQDEQNYRNDLERTIN